jgi:crotonobetainyl-CoA:carnitine CoA-transferase CaiB-like acyl-CoA transferase
VPGPLDGIRVPELGGDRRPGHRGGPRRLGRPRRAGAQGRGPAAGNLQQAYSGLDNRGKRSIASALKTEEGRGIVLALLHQADVFVTNLRPSALAVWA